MSKWTHFWDMNSGGGLKEEPYSNIYIEASEKEATIIFYNRFGHNPNRVSCTCCGKDYSISEHESLKQLTGFHRECENLVTPQDKNGLCKNDDPIIKKHYYLEKDEIPPKGYKIEKGWSEGKYQSLKEYIKNKNVLVIYAKDIKPKERVGEMPEQGYV